jgi:hypothetical protein
MGLIVRRVLLNGVIIGLFLLNSCSEKKAEEPVAAPTPAEEVPAAPAAPLAPEAPEAPVAPEATEAPAKKKAKTTKKKAKKPVKK